MKKVSENKKLKKGFTLIEMLVVVLIIGILAAIALPQYQMAVTKAKVASILPIMRAWKDALMEWKLTNGNYCKDEECTYTAGLIDLGIECPEGWGCDNIMEITNDYWDCMINEEPSGYVHCDHFMREWDVMFGIYMYQPDDHLYKDFRGMMVCVAYGEEAHRVCKALGGKLIDGYDSAYKLN